MPTYRYRCPSCESMFDVYKTIGEIDYLEKCEVCGRDHIDSSSRFIESRFFYGEKPDDPFYSQALGKVVKSRKQQSLEAKSRGWEELGTTDIEKHIDSTDRERELKAQSSWDELMRG